MTATVSQVKADAPSSAIQMMTAEEEDILRQTQESLDKLLDDKNLAKYKLEVMFSHKHTSRGPTPGLVTFWESGSKLHGGGDSKLYICDHNSMRGRGCGKFIPDGVQGLNHVVCPNCLTMWQPEHLTGEMFYVLPLEKWAEVLLRWFMRLDQRADIRVKYGRMSIRDAQTAEAERKLRGELLNKARSFDQRSCAIYPLKNIIKDVNAGADLQKRLLAFLRA